MIVFDAHCDAPSQMSRLRDYRLDNPDAQVDFPKMLRGGVDASFFAAYVPASLEGEAATAHAVRRWPQMQISPHTHAVPAGSAGTDAPGNSPYWRE